MKIERKYGFRIDIERLDKVIKRVGEAYKNKEGFFKEIKQYLPQWNLPSELEFDPQKIIPKNIDDAARYLWTSCFFERGTRSKEIMKSAKRVWDNNDQRWFFYTNQISKRTDSELEFIMRNEFHFALRGKNEESAHKRFQYNAEKLEREYGGNPINLVLNKSVDEAREKIMEFKGIGTGIANLFLIYMNDRDIVHTTDSESLMPKVDIHKGRIPINTEVIIPDNGQIYREDIVEVMEKVYRDRVIANGYNISSIDSGLWVIGSIGCIKQDYEACQKCPLLNLCISNVSENEKTGRFQILNSKGERIETRKNIWLREQMNFDF